MKATFIIIATTFAALWMTSVAAQHSPYSGQQGRAIKALSDDEVTQFLAGAGMGYARAAELNRYPGPMHVLELADKLALTHEQQAATKKFMESHKADARTIGAKLVAAERDLDRLFASGSLGQTALEQHVKTIAELQGDYRLSHLDTHRRMRSLLSEQQVERYGQLRGYAGHSDTPASMGHSGKHH
jgi:hypothetical protein